MAGWQDGIPVQQVPQGGLKPVTDPVILQQLNGNVPPPPPGYTLDKPKWQQGKPVTDPDLLRQLNAPAPPPAVSSVAQALSPGFHQDQSGQNIYQPLTGADMTAHMDEALANPDQMDIVDRNILPTLAPLFRAVNSAQDALPNLGTSVAKGSRDLIAALTSLPFDLAGSDTGETIRKAIPQVQTRGTGENVGAAITQYGLPASAAVKGAGLLTNGLPKVASWITKLLSAAVADAAATDPDQATTIGSMLPGSLGHGPTAIELDDGPMEKRAKVGAESIPVGAAIDGVVKGVSKAAKPLVPVYQNLTDEGRKLLTGKRLAEAGVPENVGTQAAPLAQDGFKPVTSDVVNTPEVQGLARGTLNVPEGAALVNRTKENEQAISTSFDKSLQPQPGVPPNAAATEFKAQGNAQVAGPAKRVDDLKAQQGAATADLAATEGSVSAKAGTRQDASESLADLIAQEKSGATQVKNGLYDKAKELGRSVNVDPGQLADAAGTVRADIGPLAQQDPSLNAILGDLDRLAPKGEVETGLLDATGKPVTRAADTVPTTLADLIDLQPRLSRAIDKATGTYRGDVVEHLTALRDQIKAQINTLSEGGSPAALALKEAETNFKTNFAPKFREGTGKALDQAERAGTPVPPTAQAGKFLKTNTASGAREAVADLNRIFAESESKPAAQKAARNYMVGLMADEMGGKIDGAKAAQFISKYGEAIDGVPGLRVEMQQMANRLKSGSAKTAAIDEELKAAEAEKAGAESTFKKSDAGLWVDGNVSDVVNAAIGDPVKMDALVKQASKDPSGAALADVKNQIKAKINDLIRNDGSQTAGGTGKAGTNDAKALENKDVVVSLAKANNLLKEGTPERAALEKVFTPEEMAKLDLYRKQLELTTRMNGMRGTKNSDTSLNILSATQAGAGVTKGNIIGSMWVRLVRFADDWSFNSVSKKADLLTKALTDPDLAGTLVMEYNASTAKIVERRLGTYLTNNVLSGGTDDERKPPRADQASAGSPFERNKPYVKAAAKDFATALQPKQEEMFRKWVKANKVPFDADSKDPQDYDMRGFYKAFMAGDKSAKSAIDPNDKRMHYPDFWKTPYHETFSNESQWATPDAPKWNNKDQLVDKNGNVIFDDRAKNGN
jgi:hypothetical protein